MAMRQVPVVGGFYDDPNKHWSRQDVLNWLPVPAERPGTKTAFRLKNAPGMRPLVDVGGEGRIRGMRNVEGKLFVVQGNQLYQISSKLVALPLGTIPGVGRVSMAHNAKGLGNELMIVNGSAGYVYDTNTKALAKVTDEGYPGAVVVDFVDQYFAQVEPQGRYWFHSDLADGHSYNTLDRYQAEADPDRITGILTLQPEVLVFGRDTTEVYVNAGGATGTFQRASNTIIQAGCSARFSPRRMDNTAFWLDDKRLVRRLDGYTPVIVSTEAINAAFWECSEAEISQAYAFTWESGSHKVYYITVPGRFTFGYDAWSQEWHRRDTPGYPHWAVTDVAFWNGEWIAADALSGRLYVLDWAYPRYGCDELVRSRTTGKLFADGNRITLNEVRLLLDTGNGEVPCVPFAEQPEGPTLSGSAPDGWIHLEYDDFTYTATPGGAPIASIKMTGGTLPKGMQFNNGVLSGTPTEVGSHTIHMRVEDENGLWALHSDTILIDVPRWDPLHTGAGGVLENATKTFVTDITTSQRPMTRSYIGATLADKFYCEVVLDVLPVVAGGDPAFSIGIVNQDHAYSNAPYVGSNHGFGAARGIGVLPGKTTGQNVTISGCGGAGSGEVFGPAFTGAGQVFRVAFDGPAGKIWVSDTEDWEMWVTNGVYGPCEAVTANPTLGTNPLSEIFAWESGTAFYVAVAGRDGDDGTHLRATLRILPEEFDYPIPGGFKALGELA